MIENEYPRDEIMSFFIWPGRKISPAAVSEIAQGQIGADIEAATNVEAERFIRKRLSDLRPFSARDYVASPISDTVVREILRTSGDVQKSFPGFETSTNEYKRDLPAGRAENARIAKAIASFANADGGYIFFGVEDDRSVVGLSNPSVPSKAWTDLSRIVVSCFTPAVSWQQNIVQIGGVPVGVIHVPESLNKPIIASRDCDGITKGTIYYRYNGLSMPIEPGDLISLLAQRERILIASHFGAAPVQKS